MPTVCERECQENTASIGVLTCFCATKEATTKDGSVLKLFVEAGRRHKRQMTFTKFSMFLSMRTSDTSSHEQCVIFYAS